MPDAKHDGSVADHRFKRRAQHKFDRARDDRHDQFDDHDDNRHDDFVDVAAKMP
jgi:hypothetical protein